MKIYFIGGASTKTDEGDPIYRDAISNGDLILIFPWTYEIEKVEYREVNDKIFERFGAKTIYAERSDSIKILKEKINSADIIYLPGGDPRVLVKNLKKTKADTLLRNFKKTLMGNSAGALVFCKKYVNVKGQDEELETNLAEGIGLVNIHTSVHYGSPEPHYGGEGDKGLVPLSKKVKIYSIPETSALIYEDGKLSRIGDVYLFDKGKKTRM